MKPLIKILGIAWLASIMAVAPATAFPVWGGGGGGAGGSLSLTASSPDIALTPSPLVGTGTIGITSLISSTCGTATSCTIQSTDLGKTVINNNASPVAVSLPACNLGSFTVGTSYSETNIGAGTATITVSANAFDGSPTSSTTLALAHNQSAWMVCEATGNWLVFGGGNPSSGSVTWPSSGSVVVSNSTASPAGVAEIDGDCLVGAAGVWGAGACASTSSTITSSSANAFAVGANGSTNPVFNIDASTGSVISGISIKGAATTGITTITPTDTNAAANLQIKNKGAGTLYLGSGPTTGIVALNGGAAATSISLSPNAEASQSTANMSYLSPADTAMVAGTDVPTVRFNFGTNSRQHATGALALNQDFKVIGATHTFVGASTATNLATMGVTAPGCGTNATCTNVESFYHPSTALTATGTITNSFGINVAADTGATNNYAANFTGPVIMNGYVESIGSAPTIAGNACGSATQGTVTGTDNSMIVTVGTAAVTSCAISFATTHATAPQACSLSDANAAAAATSAYVSAPTTTGVTINGAALASTAYVVQCF